MKKLIVFVLTLFVLGISQGLCEEQPGPRLDGKFSAKTKDNEAETIGDVTINQEYTSQTVLTWSLSEIDYYIETYTKKVAEFQNYVDSLKKLRDIIEKEALKVKLKEPPNEKRGT